MNGEIEKEKSQTMALLIINGIIWIPLFIIILLIIGVAKVNAAQYRYLNNDNGSGSWTNISFNNTTYTNTPITTNTTGKTVFQLRDNTAMASGNKYDLLLNFDYEVTATATVSNIDAIASIAIEVYNGSTLKDISSQCSTNYVQTNTNNYETPLYSNTHRILGTIKCTAISEPGYYPYFGFQFKRNNVLIAGKGTATIKFLSWSYTLNQGATDTNTIVNNNNANTQSIINNNNYNTQQVIDSIQEWEGANQPSSSTSDTAFDKEDLIFDSLEMDFTLERPQIDTTANELIWNWVHRLLFTNTVIAGVTIALLTFGIIKLILGR